MKKKKFNIDELKSDESVPYSLLLLADPSRKQIDKYLKSGICLVAKYKSKTIGVAVLKEMNNNQIEVKNIAIDNSYQGKGFGKKLLKFIIKYAKKTGASKLKIGTGNSSIGQLALYQKVGFNLEEIDKNFFVKNYSETIFENGIQCKHLVILSMDLK